MLKVIVIVSAKVGACRVSAKRSKTRTYWLKFDDAPPVGPENWARSLQPEPVRVLSTKIAMY